MRIRIVLALGKNNEIGAAGKLLWDLPKDMAHFRAITLGKPVIMGRKTYESIGHPLPKRTNIVVTRNPDYEEEGVVITSSFLTALEIAEAEEPEEVCVIGGGELVATALPYATHLSLTFVDGEFPEADAFFPEVEWKDWQEVSVQDHAANSEHAYAFRFVEYEREKAS